MFLISFLALNMKSPKYDIGDPVKVCQKGNVQFIDLENGEYIYGVQVIIFENEHYSEVSVMRFNESELEGL